jgi:MFS family permease
MSADVSVSDADTGAPALSPKRHRALCTHFGFRFVTPLALGSTLNPVNSTMISTALVPIATDYHASVADTGWLVAGLYLTSAIAQPTMGRLADLFGARRIYLFSLCFVALAGLAGALAPSLGALIAVRVLLGIGTSGAYPAAMRIFRTQADRVSAEPPRIAMSVLSFAGVATTAVGPLLGGLLTGAFGWHAIFTINLPLAMLTILLVALWIPKDKPTEGDFIRLMKELDLIGIGLFAAFLLSLMFFLMNLDHPMWLALPIAAVFCVALVTHSLRRAHPFIDVRMLVHNRPLAMTYVRVALILLIVYSVLYGFAQWLEAGAGFSSTAAGLITLPMSVCATLSSLAGARSGTIRMPFIISTVGALIGCLCLFLIDHQTPVWMIAIAVMFFGLPTGLTSTATQVAVYVQTPAAEIGTASGLQRTATYMGAITSTSLLGLLYGQHATDRGLHSLAIVMGLLSAVLLVATIFDRTLPRGAIG